MNNIYRKAICVLIVTSFFSVGYAKNKSSNSDKPDPVIRISENEIIRTENDIIVNFAAIADQELAEEYLGLDTVKSNMLPVLLKITNNRDEIIRVELDDMKISNNNGTNYSVLPIGEAVKRAKKSDASVVAFMIFFPAGTKGAGDRAAEAHQTLEVDYHKRYFKPTLLNIGATGQGLIFIDAPQETHMQMSSAVIYFTSLMTKEKYKIEFEIGKSETE